MKKHINEVADFETKQPGIRGIVKDVSSNSIVMMLKDENRTRVFVPEASILFKENQMVSVYGNRERPQAVVNYETQIAYIKDP
jgi:catabolite regulation protein CreA|tara:strand:+ start:690 stop:938 length:249 start_codon:yes stop_codon:yes gene_type:complete